MTAFLRTSMAFLAIFLVLGCIFRLSTLPLDDADVEDSDGYNARFSFRDPVALFFPMATISLTDDNSTFFNAKPAAFGPSLPQRGINGPIWIGNGFAVEGASHHRHGSASHEGEQGCDDIPDSLRRGWRLSDLYLTPKLPEPGAASGSHTLRNLTGKIALLSRGGCGFSEKVEWAQRRGAAAVIIGDNVPGGPLVRMYAQGDISNITIPSIFTSHTTAHLLSSLMPRTEASTSGNGDLASSPPGVHQTIPTTDDLSDIIDTHAGLWVTLTEADMSASPFFNTLFVLVVSPLFTLAIVYSMLLLRSRIRRRRWRAPKSVVERLPVRVYHNLSSQGSPTCGTPVEGRCTSATPLLNPRASLGFSHGEQSTGTSPPSSSQYGSLEPSSAAEKEKIEAGLAEWRRRYSGKQKECVVCLDEYVDGVSRVMSLPCGHEFHVDCITPWLTTRRRTCPICKGDVVRSQERDSERAGHDVSDETEEEIQAQVAETVNSSPSAALPVPQPSLSQSRGVQRNASSGSILSSFGSPPFWSSRQALRSTRIPPSGARGSQDHDREERNGQRNQ